MLAGTSTLDVVVSTVVLHYREKLVFALHRAIPHSIYSLQYASRALYPLCTIPRFCTVCVRAPTLHTLLG